MSMPRRIRRPKKILFVLGILVLLYWFGIRHGFAGDAAPPPSPLGFVPGSGHRIRPRTMQFLKNGLAEILPLRRGSRPEHPFYELMEKGEEQWRTIRERQSRSLDDAVKQYKFRYNLDPPAGFDAWFAWAREHGVELVDEYDLMMRDVLAHHALEPAEFVNRSAGLEGSKHTYTLDITKEGVKVTGDRANAARPKHLAAFIEGFKDTLPKGFNLRITGSDHDMSGVVLGKDQRRRAMELVRKKQHFTPEELETLENPGRTPAWGWFKSCPLDSPANAIPNAENIVPDENAPKSFVWDHLATMDFCEFPELKRLHGALCVDRNDRSPSILKPWLVHSKLPGDASFLIPPIDGYTNTTHKDIAKLGTWEDKLDPRVHWRGQSTGGYDTQIDWRQSHRMRLHHMFNGKQGGDHDWDESTANVFMPDGYGGYEKVVRKLPQLSKAYGDVKLTGKPIQCPNDEVCAEIAKEVEFGHALPAKNSWMFRYMLDVDGNGWSERFFRLLSSASPVLKMTIFADWEMDRLVPWYHYIPIRADYSDAWDVLAFFIGPIRSDGTVDHSKGHDYLGKKIGAAGQEFALSHWRWVDMQAYMYRLLLELDRLHSLDRAAASYKRKV
ncbi:hypothetical protein Q8F55_000644 [Vanrija albida]|uniref:Glycosyl transferase CAP10 domain-containing protein n=1 Tax=Vanrija albida TaxID=181172 RepID=A0ABR3QE11_9TREE